MPTINQWCIIKTFWVQGFTKAQVKCERFLNLRYHGTDVAVMTPCPLDGGYAAAFESLYQREFGFKLDRPIVVDDVRVRATGSAMPVASRPVGADNPGVHSELVIGAGPFGTYYHTSLVLCLRAI